MRVTIYDRFPIRILAALLLLLPVAPVHANTPTTLVAGNALSAALSMSAAATGIKNLYLYDNTNVCPAPHNTLLNLSRLPPACAQTFEQISGGASQTWTQGIPLAASLLLDGSLSGNVIQVTLQLNTQGPGSSRTIQACLNTTSGALGAGAGICQVVVTTLPNQSSTPFAVTFNLPFATTATVPAGDTFVLQVNNQTTPASRRIRLHPTFGVNNSIIFLPAATVINVDSVDGFDAAFAGGAIPTAFTPGDTVFLRMVVSDPFGSFDIVTGAVGTTTSNVVVSIATPGGTTLVTNADTTLVADSGADTKTFEFQYLIPPPTLGVPYPDTGFWDVDVTAIEGTEGTISHAETGQFRVELPFLIVTKLAIVISDPVGGPFPHAIPGAVIGYQVTVMNAGLGRATSVVLTDDLDAEISAARIAFNPNTFAVGEGIQVTAPDINGGVTVSRTNAEDADECEFDGVAPAPTPNTVICQAGQLDPGELAQMEYEVTIQ